MQFINLQSRYGLVSIALHWVIAVMTIALFFSGIWMVDLGYYDAWYNRAPWWHKNVGVVLLALILVRWLWRLVSPSPLAIESIEHWQQKAAHTAHFLMNILMVVICMAGYFIVTAKGQGLPIFDWLTIPAINLNITNLEDLAGTVHFLLAYLLVFIVCVHVAAAFFHHFISKDDTLKRMFGLKEKSEN